MNDPPTEQVDGQVVCADVPERPPFTSDDEWRAMRARAGTVIPGSAQEIAVVVLRAPNSWTEPETRVFVGDGPDIEDQAEQAAWDHWAATGRTSYVEVAWSWLNVGDQLTVTSTCYSPGLREQDAGFRFTSANRDDWINL